MTGNASNGVVQYDYSLKTNFELTDAQKGYYYRFVEFTGIVNPDEQCVFLIAAPSF